MASPKKKLTDGLVRILFTLLSSILLLIWEAAWFNRIITMEKLKSYQRDNTTGYSGHDGACSTGIL